MQVHLITIEFIFRGCRSLKEKRSRLKGIRDRLGKLRHIAIAESDFQNSHDRSEWSIVVLVQNNKLFDKTLALVDEELQQVDGEVVARKLERV